MMHTTVENLPCTEVELGKGNEEEVDPLQQVIVCPLHETCLLSHASSLDDATLDTSLSCTKLRACSLSLSLSLSLGSLRGKAGVMSMWVVSVCSCHRHTATPFSDVYTSILMLDLLLDFDVYTSI